MPRVAHIQPIATGGRLLETGHVYHSQILQHSVFGACLGESGAFDEIRCSVLVPLQRSVFGACLGESGAFDEIQCSVFSHPHHSDPEPNWYIYHSDHLGSSAFLTDAAGDPTQHLQYMPFGEPFIEQRSITSYYTPYTFSAKERDTETGYSYFGARYYDADISVWLSVDPMAWRLPWISAYNYCYHRPVRFIDPDGRFSDEPDKIESVTWLKPIVVTDAPRVAETSAPISNQSRKASRNPEKVGFWSRVGRVFRGNRSPDNSATSSSTNRRSRSRGGNHFYSSEGLGLETAKVGPYEETPITDINMLVVLATAKGKQGQPEPGAMIENILEGTINVSEAVSEANSLSEPKKEWTATSSKVVYYRNSNGSIGSLDVPHTNHNAMRLNDSFAPSGIGQGNPISFEQYQQLKKLIR